MKSRKTIKWTDGGGKKKFEEGEGGRGEIRIKREINKMIQIRSFLSSLAKQLPKATVNISIFLWMSGCPYGIYRPQQCRFS